MMEGCEMMLEGRSEGSVEVRWDGCHFLKHVFRIYHVCENYTFSPLSYVWMSK